MSEVMVGKQVKNGFRRAGAWLLGFGWLFLVFGGLAIITTPPPPSAVLGWVLLSIAAVVLILTMDKWVRVFPGLLAYGVLGSTLMLVNGHAVNHPEVDVPRLEAVILIAFFAAATALSFYVHEAQVNSARPHRTVCVYSLFFLAGSSATSDDDCAGHWVCLSCWCVGI
jgi:hypothetical protein